MDRADLSEAVPGPEFRPRAPCPSKEERASECISVCPSSWAKLRDDELDGQDRNQENQIRSEVREEKTRKRAEKMLH